MVGHIKLAGLIVILLVILLPSFALAQDTRFSVSPAEVHIDNLTPGEAIEFELTIYNKEELTHNFTIATFQPTEDEMREGRAEFPDPSWISLSSQEIELATNSDGNVAATIAIPQEPKWAGKDWEIWLGVAAESSDLLTVKLYVRLLVSTNPVTEARFNAGLVTGIVVGIVLLGCGGYYYYKRKANHKRV